MGIILLRYVDAYNILSDKDFNHLLLKKALLTNPSIKYLLKLLLID